MLCLCLAHIVELGGGALWTLKGGFQEERILELSLPQWEDSQLVGKGVLGVVMGRASSG